MIIILIKPIQNVCYCLAYSLWPNLSKVPKAFQTHGSELRQIINCFSCWTMSEQKRVKKRVKACSISRLQRMCTLRSYRQQKNHLQSLISPEQFRNPNFFYRMKLFSAWRLRELYACRLPIFMPITEYSKEHFWANRTLLSSSYISSQGV